MARKTFYITTPIYYVNDRPHIGHAYTSLACDVVARFKRLCGFEVHLLSGTDEHGQKVEAAAKKKGQDPQDFVDGLYKSFQDLEDLYQCTYDDFIRTTEPRHIRGAQAFWKLLAEKGAVYKGSYEGWYAVRDEAFYFEKELTTTPEGKKIASSGAEVQWLIEESYFFKLSAYRQPLLELYEKNPDFIQPASRRHEVISFVKEGLEDLSISRTSFCWGVPVPSDSRHIMYVWIEALSNYITALGYGKEDLSESLMERFWPANIHMVGKDILRFHAVYWPAFLMAAGLPLPQRIFAHGWWTNEGQKISKSLGNVIDPVELVQTYGLDAVRYFLMRAISFGQDGDFSRAALAGRLNADLADSLGNLCQRVLSFVQQHAGGRVPQAAGLKDLDRDLLKVADSLLGEVEKHMDRCAFHLALEAIFQCVRQANAYVGKVAFWRLRTEDRLRMEAVLWVCLEVMRKVALVLQPFIPASAHAILQQLGLRSSLREGIPFDTWQTPLPAGDPLPPPSPVFKKYLDA